jgi:membrane-associated phospholipid phosphatase
MQRGAVACAVLAALVYVGAFHVEPFAALDRRLLSAFIDVQMGVPGADVLARTIVHLLLPQVILGVSAVAIAVALVRRDLPAAAAAAVTVVAANVVTQWLQVLTWVPRGHEELAMQASRWPSGHAAGVTAMAFALTMAAPAPARRVVGAVAVIVATLDCLSILVIHWHFPSDVAGGVVLAAAFGLGSWAAARAWPARAERHRAPGVRPLPAPPLKGSDPLSGRD